MLMSSLLITAASVGFCYRSQPVRPDQEMNSGEHALKKGKQQISIHHLLTLSRGKNGLCYAGTSYLIGSNSFFMIFLCILFFSPTEKVTFYA